MPGRPDVACNVTHWSYTMCIMNGAPRAVYAPQLIELQR